MMSEYKLEAVGKTKRGVLSSLFQDFKWNYLVDSVLDGYMGEVFVDNQDNPHIAVLEAPDLKLIIVGGNPGHPSARKYLEGLVATKLIIFASEEWERLMREIHKGRLVLMPRYVLSSEKLDITHLNELKSRLPEGYFLKRMDLEITQRLANENSKFSSDHMIFFESPEDFIARGFGFCALYGDEVVCAVTTFAVCNRGIEIQISTRENHRGRGLATAVAAQMLIYSLENNLDPNWDAANKMSVGLAKKLGYVPKGTYSIYIFVRSRFKAVYGKILLKTLELLKK
jgi:RimJ/RimL family protein N-acetyltransferase